MSVIADAIDAVYMHPQIRPSRRLITVAPLYNASYIDNPPPHISYCCCATSAVYCGLSPDGKVYPPDIVLQRIKQLVADENVIDVISRYVSEMFQNLYPKYDSRPMGPRIMDWYDTDNKLPEHRVEFVKLRLGELENELNRAGYV